MNKDSKGLVKNMAKEVANASKGKGLRALTESVQSRIAALMKEGKLNLPENYSIGNALTSARLEIENTKDMFGNPALKVCTPTSIANSLLQMTILGLNTVKKQCYFIVYGDQLSCFVSVFGKAAIFRRFKGVEREPVGTILYVGDTFDIEIDPTTKDEVITNHKMSWENKVKAQREGAYATVVMNGVLRSAVMTMDQIKEAWTMTRKKDKDHKVFTEEFMKRTVINRLMKYIIQTTMDDDLTVGTIIENDEEHYDFEETEIETITNVNTQADANTGEIIGADLPEEITEIEEAPKGNPNVIGGFDTSKWDKPDKSNNNEEPDY